MKYKKLIAGLVTLIFVMSIFSMLDFTVPVVKGTDVSGTQSGVWDVAGSPYIVTENVIVESGTTLEIKPGVVIKFDLGKKMYILGILFANGTKTNPITFTSNVASPYIYCWEGIKFHTLGSGIVQNCSFTYARNGIDVEASYKLKIKNCKISYCENATRFNTVTMLDIENCNIFNNTDNGIQLKWGFGSVRISNNTIYNNSKGIRLIHAYKSIIENNTLDSNLRGIRLRSSGRCQISNNSIYNTNPSGRSRSSREASVPNEFEDDDLGSQNFPPSSSSRNSNRQEWDDDDDDYDDLIEDDKFNEIDWIEGDHEEEIYAALYLNRSNSNSVFNNKIINVSGYGILVNRSYNNTFENNYIENTSLNGICLYSLSIINTFKNNTIKNIDNSAIALTFQSNGNTFQNNNITKPNYHFGIEYERDSTKNIFTRDNLVNNIPLRVYYQESGSKISSELKDITIVLPKMTNLGQIVIIESRNFNIRGVQLTKGQSGIFFFDSHNGIIIDSKIINNDVYGIDFGYNSTNISVLNSTVSTSGVKDFNIDDFSNVTVVNTTFNRARVSYGYYSNLTVQWFLHVKVVYGVINETIPFAKIKVHDNYNKLIYNGSTDNNGILKFIRCTDMLLTNNKSISFNPYNVSALKIHYQPGYAGSGIVMDMTKWVTLKLTDNHNPTLSGQIKPAVTHNRTPTIEWPSGTDTDNDILGYNVQLWNLNNKDEIIESNSTQTSKYIVKTNLTYGERYGVNIIAFDPYGGWSNYITGSFAVVNSAPSAPKIMIYPLQTDKRPSRNEDLNCTIIKPSVDNDTNPKDVIKYNYRWYKNDVLQVLLSTWNTTKLYHILPKEYTSTNDIWRCEVTATDGFKVTEPVGDSRIIKNNPPRLNNTIPFLKILEDTVDSTSINLRDIFVDDDFEPLTFDYINSGKNISVQIFQHNGTVILIPKQNWNGYEDIRFTATDNEDSTYINTRIKVLPVPDPPTVKIVLPKTKSYFIHNNSRGVSFVGVYEDPDIPYGEGDVLNLTWISNISGVLGYGDRLNNLILPIGSHKIDFIGYDSTNNSDRDSIIIHIINRTGPFNIPEVKLINPLSRQVINSTRATLSWTTINLNSSDMERVLFDVYLDTSETPSEILVTEYLGNNLTITGLEDNTKYYWTVIPYLDEFQGICVDEVWNFTIDLNFTSIYGVELNMIERELIIETGAITVYNFTVKNLGNGIDDFIITLSFLNGSDLIDYTTLQFDKVILEPSESITINLTFNISEDYSNINEILMLINVYSSSGPASAMLSRNIKIIDEEEALTIEDETPAKIPLGIIYLLLFILITILIIFLLLLFFFTRLFFWLKKQPQHLSIAHTNIIFPKKRSVTKEKVRKK